ncbi:hypothetical protein [Pseudomonas sp. TMW22091]|uniref:hypothetical protein n=1 Tax=Pseudomonas sp. TMW22091 TaxID=2506435 RepID=UPI001F0D0E32|nr:hypothetical protein [Pseudomonas sp. TMW22091]MCH4872979.1 hypothetical protein [Pseudomonas sp. TMW22091]
MSLSDDLKSAISTADVEQNLINTVPELREFIHFDTLWQLASLIVLEHGHLDWSDTAEHDPGTTLLQAATYAIADLSYRHTHPLIDLLTPGQGKPVFDPAFGPEKVLTVSPVTEDDYRRGILDLCSLSGDEFLFRNAQLVEEATEESYQYFYDRSMGTYTFKMSEGTVNSESHILLGGYTLYVEPFPSHEWAMARPILEKYLTEHRNLGEQIRLIYHFSEYLDAEILSPYIDVELDDDCQNPTQIMAEIWKVTTTVFAPWPQRESEASSEGAVGSIDKFYEGPNLVNGWITQLPPDVDYTKEETFDLRDLSLELLKIDGVKQIRRLSWSETELVWTKNKAPLRFLMLWGEAAHFELEKADATVRLFKRGQRQAISSLASLIKWPEKKPPSSVTVPEGQYLESMAEDINISALLPDCYGLNDVNQLSDVEKKQRQNLEGYLSLFQLWFKNGCDELAGLPKLLAFDQSVDLIGSGYFQDYEKSLTTINYLLGYFGSQRAPRVFNKTGVDLRAEDEFFESQRAALAQWGELGYGRANVPVNTVTAFNKRLAFRLGIGADMFSEKPDLEKLPVYVVDYRTLLPEMPNPEFENRKLKSATLVTTDGVEQLKFEFDEGALPAAGQLISLDVVEPSIKILWALVVRVEANYVYLDLENNPRLREKANQLDGLADAGDCNNSDIWLRRMTYPLVDVENLPKATVLASDYFYRLHVPYSVHVFNNGDTVKVDTSLIKSMSHFDGSTAIVEEIDIPSGTLLVKAESEWPAVNNEVFWYRVETNISDRFSLKVGVVLDRERWLKEVRPEEVMTWVEQIVREEMPAHLQADVHWLSSDEFESFGYNYKKWQQAAAESRLGETSYALMKQLSLGQLPAAGRGIGVYHLITTDEERLGAEAGWYSEGDPGHWLEGSEVEVEAASIVYVPRDVE